MSSQFVDEYQQQIEVTVGVISTNSVLGAGLQAMVSQVPFVTHVGQPGPDPRAIGNYDLLIMDGDSVQSFSPALRPRVMVAVHSRADEPGTFSRHVTIDGFVEVDNLSTARLGEAIHQCLVGQYPVPPGWTRTLMRGKHLQASAAVRAITAREKQALQHVADGLSNEQVARHLGISAHGAKRLVASLMVKLDATNRTSAVVNAITAGVLECPSRQCVCSTTDP